MKDLLIKMASIANELDSIGLEKEANQITVDMLKLAQHYGSDYNQPKSMYDKRRYTSSNYLMDSYLRKAKKQNMSINQLYQMVKNEANEKTANDLVAILKEAGYTDPTQKVPSNFSISSVGPTQGLYESQTKKQQGMFEARGNKIKSSPDEIEKTLEKYHATHTIRQMYDELFKQNKKTLANDLAALLSLDGYNQANPVPSGLTSLTRSRAGMR